ncbi:hypothetical protein [Faecalitalea cylindroides]|uniref:hypothetical protein n=1 Tax=Faecalitalea cylindroides TaxID=39483 RepID=UPI0022E559AD|nr:hypothetical protein [Faecalitalea cylindroides]
MNRKIKNVISICLIASMQVPLCTPIYAEEQNENPTEKKETVYTLLDGDGTVSKTIVSSWLHDEDGLRNIQEILDLSNVENVESNVEPKVNGNLYTWNTEDTDIYYQGDCHKKLPVNFEIKYYLDGKEITADKLQGKTGHLSIKINMKPNVSQTVMIQNQPVTIHPSFLCAAGMILDNETVKNVEGNNGRVINDGSHEAYVFASVPGLKQTLDEMGLHTLTDKLSLVEETSIEADVENFSLDSFFIGMSNEIPFENLFESSSVTSGIQSLMSAGDQLLNGSKALQEGIHLMNQESQPLTSAYPQIENLAQSSVLMHEGTTSLYNALNEYTSGVEAIDKGNKQLYSVPKGIKDAGDGTQNLHIGAQKLQSGIEQINSKISSLDPETIDEISNIILNSKQQLNQMEKTIQKDSAIMTEMSNSIDLINNSMESLNQVKTEFVNAVQEYNKVIETNNEKVSQNNQIIDSYRNQMQRANDTLNQAAQTTNEKLDETIVALQQVQQSTEDETLRAKLQEQIETIESEKIEASTLTVDYSNLSSLEPIDSQPLELSLKTLSDSISKMNDILAESNKVLPQLENDIIQSKETLNTLDAYLNTVVNRLPEDPESIISTLQQSVKQLEAGSKSLSQGCEQLDQGLNVLYEESMKGIDQLNEGSETLVSYNSELLEGSKALDQGAEQLEAQKNNFSEMSNGLISLQKAFDELSVGADQLVNGQSTFNEEGLGSLAIASEELNKLNELAQQIDSLNKKYSSFSGAPKEATNSTQYIFKVTSSN